MSSFPTCRSLCLRQEPTKHPRSELHRLRTLQLRPPSPQLDQRRRKRRGPAQCDPQLLFPQRQGILLQRNEVSYPCRKPSSTSVCLSDQERVPLIIPQWSDRLTCSSRHRCSLGCICSLLVDTSSR